MLAAHLTSDGCPVRWVDAREVRPYSARLRGIPDGVIAGFEKDRMPIVGLIVSPINAATGLLTGMVEGAAMGPAFITPDTDLGRTFGKPTQVPTSIWWY